MNEFSDEFHKTAANLDPPPVAHAEALTIGQFLSAFWQARKFVAVILFFCFTGAILYLAFVAQPVYRARAVIGPSAGGAPSIGGGTGAALAMYAGIDLGGDTTTFMKYLQVVHSTRLAAVLDKKYNLLKTSYPGWDEDTKQWNPPNGLTARFTRAIRALIGMPPWSPPTASTLADQLGQKLNVTKIPGGSLIDMKTQLYTVSLDGPNRERAVQLLTAILVEADGIVRADRLGNAARRMIYLKQMSAQSPELFLRDSLQQVAMEQQRNLMMLNADRLYAVDLIDPPNADSTAVAPRGRTVMMIALSLGLIMSMLAIYLMLYAHVGRLAAGRGDLRSTPFRDPFDMAFAATRRRFARQKSSAL